MLTDISYYLILGKPLIMYLGILTYLSLVFTASISFLHRRGIPFVPFRWHHRMAIITLILATIHGLLGILAYF